MISTIDRQNKLSKRLGGEKKNISILTELNVTEVVHLEVKKRERERGVSMYGIESLSFSLV